MPIRALFALILSLSALMWPGAARADLREDADALARAGNWKALLVELHADPGVNVSQYWFFYFRALAYYRLGEERAGDGDNLIFEALAQSQLKTQPSGKEAIKKMQEALREARKEGKKKEICLSTTTGGAANGSITVTVGGFAGLCAQDAQCLKALLEEFERRNIPGLRIEIPGQPRGRIEGPPLPLPPSPR